jgi:hypothetical protein
MRLPAMIYIDAQKPNKAPEPTITAVTIRAPSSTARASCDRGSSLTLDGRAPYAHIERICTDGHLEWSPAGIPIRPSFSWPLL